MRYRLRTLLIALTYLLLAFASAKGQAAGDVHAGTFNANGIKIHYVLQGQGQPVVLIHSLHAGAEKIWQLPGTVHELAKTNQVIAIDLPGHGRSDRPQNEEAYGKQLVEDVVLLLDHLKIPKAHIVGYAIGGVITMKFLAMHPDRAISGTIGGTGWYRPQPMSKSNTTPPPAQDDPNRTPRAFSRTLGELETSAEELLRITLPVKVIIGERDPVKPLYLTRLKEARPDWPIVEIKGAGHVNCYTKPEFQAELAGWIRMHSAGN